MSELKEVMFLPEGAVELSYPSVLITEGLSRSSYQLLVAQIELLLRRLRIRNRLSDEDRNADLFL